MRGRALPLLLLFLIGFLYSFPLPVYASVDIQPFGTFIGYTDWANEIGHADFSSFNNEDFFQIWLDDPDNPSWVYVRPVVMSSHFHVTALRDTSLRVVVSASDNVVSLAIKWGTFGIDYSSTALYYDENQGDLFDGLAPQTSYYFATSPMKIPAGKFFSVFPDLAFRVWSAKVNNDVYFAWSGSALAGTVYYPSDDGDDFSPGTVVQSSDAVYIQCPYAYFDQLRYFSDSNTRYYGIFPGFGDCDFRVPNIGESLNFSVALPDGGNLVVSAVRVAEDSFDYRVYVNGSLIGHYSASSFISPSNRYWFLRLASSYNWKDWPSPYSAVYVRVGTATVYVDNTISYRTVYSLNDFDDFIRIPYNLSAYRDDYPLHNHGAIGVFYYSSSSNIVTYGSGSVENNSSAFYPSISSGQVADSGDSISGSLTVTSGYWDGFVNILSSLFSVAGDFISALVDLAKWSLSMFSSFFALLKDFSSFQFLEVVPAPYSNIVRFGIYGLMVGFAMRFAVWLVGIIRGVSS